MCKACVPTTNAPKRRSRKYDPTRTGGLRKSFEKELIKRWGKVTKAVLREVGTKDGLAINLARFDFPTDQGKVATFMTWFDDQVAKAVFGKGIRQKSYSLSVRSWWGTRYVKQSYAIGAEGGASRIRRAGGRVSQDYARRVIGVNKHADAVERAYVRAYDGLRNINAKMSEQIGQVMSKGILDGKGAMDLAREINDRVEKIGITRSRMLARTEINSAYNEAQLNVFDDAGIIGVDVEAELLTAEDDQVCEICEEAATKSYSISEARGILPLHPNCRCAWAPKIDRPTARGIDLK